MPYTFNPFTATLDYYIPGDVTAAVANIKADVAPSTTPDGSTTVYTVPEAYISGSLTVYLNGLAETNSSETSTTTFTFDTAPETGDIVRLSYAVEAA